MNVLDVVDAEMWCHEAENACAKHFGITLEAAIGLVEDAVQAGLIEQLPGKVRPALRIFVAAGDYEAHWVIAATRPEALVLLTDWLKESSGAWEEYQELFAEEGPDPWRWQELGPDDSLTGPECLVSERLAAEGETDDDGEVTLLVREWIKRHGRGHLAWSEIG